MAPKTREYLSSAQIASAVGVTPTAVTQSLRRHGPGTGSPRPFPVPRVRVGTAWGWDPSQLDDILAWFRVPVSGRSLSAEGQPE